MVTVVREVIDHPTAAGHPTMHLFVRIGQPNNIYAQVGKVALFGFQQESGVVASMKGRSVHAFATVVGAATILLVIGTIAVAKTVHQHKIDGRFVPSETIFFCLLSA